ncbi:hypothetical protein ACTXKP_18995 [Pseudomonas lundensis]
MAGSKHSGQSFTDRQPKKPFVQHARLERPGLQEWVFSRGAYQQMAGPSASINKFHAVGLSIFC